MHAISLSFISTCGRDLTVLALVAICMLSPVLHAEENQTPVDSVTKQLQVSTDKYEKAMEEYRKAAREWFDSRESKARDAGKKDLLDQVEVDRSEFEGSNLLPQDAPLQLQQKGWNAHAAMERAYRKAIADYVKRKKDDEADSTRNLLDRLIRKYDRLPAGSVWKGDVSFTSTDKKLKPYNGPAEMTITGRNTDSFTTHASHSRDRQWDYEFEFSKNGYRATLADLVVTQNQFGDQKGPRTILHSEVKFVGNTLMISVTRQENDHQARLIYKLNRE